MLRIRKNIGLRRSAKKFVEESFSPEILIDQWIKLFGDVKNEVPAEYHETLVFCEKKKVKSNSKWLLNVRRHKQYSKLAGNSRAENHLSLDKCVCLFHNRTSGMVIKAIQ